MNKKFSWKDFAIVFQHYIKKEMKSRAYIIVTVILCIASIASCFIVDGIVNGQEKEELRIIDKTGIFAGYLVSDSVDEDYFTGVKPVLSDDTSISKEDMLTDIEENGGAYAVFSKDGDDVKLTVYNNGDLSAADQTALINLTQNIYTQMNIGRLGISPEMFEEASRQIGFEEITPAGKPQNFWTTYILFMLMVLAIVMYSSSSGTEVAALKTNKVMEIDVFYYLILSTVMMFAGIYGFFTRRNLLATLISVELMLNATNINFAVFNRYFYPGALEGHFFTLFGIAISAAETAVAIAIMINVYRNIRNIQTDDVSDLKG